MIRPYAWPVVALSIGVVSLSSACTAGTDGATEGASSAYSDDSLAAARHRADAGHPGSTTDGGSHDASVPSTGDGTPTRVACTSNFGRGLTATHGRLDGYLVSVVPESTRSCNGDGTHVHLQIEQGGAVYDVAVNVDGFEAETTSSLPGPAWSEGFHAGAKLDYVADLDLHSTEFTLTGLDAVRQRVEAAIANANHVAIYATGYGPSGAHLVHRQGAEADGAIFLDPLGPKPSVLAFRFSSQSF